MLDKKEARCTVHSLTLVEVFVITRSLLAQFFSESQLQAMAQKCEANLFQQQRTLFDQIQHELTWENYKKHVVQDLKRGKERTRR